MEDSLTFEMLDEYRDLSQIIPICIRTMADSIHDDELAEQIWHIEVNEIWVRKIFCNGQ